MCCDPNPVRKRMRLNGVAVDESFIEFVSTRAKDHDLCGFLSFKREEALIEIEGDGETVESFIHDLAMFEPMASLMKNVAATDIPLYGGGGFSVNRV